MSMGWVDWNLWVLSQIMKYHTLYPKQVWIFSILRNFANVQLINVHNQEIDKRLRVGLLFFGEIVSREVSRSVRTIYEITKLRDFFATFLLSVIWIFSLRMLIILSKKYCNYLLSETQNEISLETQIPWFQRIFQLNMHEIYKNV